MPSRDSLLEAEIKQLGPEAHQYFLEMVAGGCEAPLAHMLIFQEAPMMKGSDKSFNESMRMKMNNMLGRNRDKAVEVAQRAGVNTNGKYYVGGLGTYTDPAAWVSTVDDVKEVCRKRNLNASGLVDHKARQVEPPKKKPLADDIVDRFVKKELADPKVSELVRRGRLSPQALREKAVATHAGSRRMSRT